MSQSNGAGKDIQSRPPFTVTLVQSSGGPLCKTFSVNGTGQLACETTAQLWKGGVEQRAFESLDAFMDWRSGLTPNQALMMGQPCYQKAQVVTQRELARIGAEKRATEKIIARDRDHVSWPEGPCLAMVDVDNPQDVPNEQADRISMTPEGIRELLMEIFPALGGAQMSWAPSSSSFISVDGKQVRGLRGQRFYIPLESGLLVPDFEDVLKSELIKRDLFWIMLSKSGQRLVRYPFDLAVYQPERLDFAARPICQEPVKAQPVEHRLWNEDGPYLGRSDLPQTTQHQKREAEAAVRRKRRAKTAEAEEAQERWVEETGRNIAIHNPRLDREEASRIARRAVKRRVAGPEFLLRDRNGEQVTVGELLQDSQRHHGRRFCDPLEPDYRGDERIAVFLADDYGGGCIYSHAHGGYTLRCQREAFTVVLSLIDQSVDRIKDALAHERAGLFRMGSEIVCVDEVLGRIQALDDDGLACRIQRPFKVLRQAKDGPRPSNITTREIRALRAEASQLPIDELQSVIRAPFARGDGSICDTPGYDPASQVMYIGDSASPMKVRARLSRQEAEEALRDFWYPFSNFDLPTDEDRGAALAAALTCLCRDGLQIAPGYAITASTAGTGKTTLARALGALHTGSPVPVTTLPENEAELRKQIFAAVRKGDRFIVFDNAERGAKIDSTSLAQHVTSGQVSSRVLGKSKYEQWPNRLTPVITGNNISVCGDMSRRMLPITLEASVERPWTRKFPFDPVAFILANWRRLRVAGLELISAANQEQSASADEATGFPEWDNVVRSTVRWIVETLDIDIGFSDPAELMKETYEDDSEREVLGELLQALFEVFGDDRFSAREAEDEVDAARLSTAMQTGETPEGEVLWPQERLRRARGAIVDREYTQRNPRELGRYLASYRDRIVNGLRLERGGKTGGSRRWRVVQIEQPGIDS